MLKNTKEEIYLPNPLPNAPLHTRKRRGKVLGSAQKHSISVTF